MLYPSSVYPSLNALPSIPPRPPLPILSSLCKECHIIQKEQVSWRRTEARAINICRSRPSPEYAEDSEEDKTPLQIYDVEYEQGDRLFMTRILLEPAMEDLRATSTISQKLAEGAHRASET